jgi:uncharacterized protein (DUF1697 family)
MTVFISMLRGVNVGGHHKIKMEALRALYESLGLQDAQSHIQSGNVIFRANGNVVRLAKLLEDGIERDFGFRPRVIVRTTSELREAIARNPFAERPDIDPSRLLVTFFAGDPGAEAREKVLAMATDPEELRIEGREMYVYYPNGMARPNLPSALIERTLKVPGTGRNWNTVMKLLAIAEKMEAY